LGAVPGLEYITDSPPNAAVPLTELDGRLIPQDRAYMRNSFEPPKEVTDVVAISLPGLPPRTLTPVTLSALDQVEMEIVLECAGNGRSLIRPEVSGVQWGFGGVSPLKVGGMRLIEALGEVPDEVVEIVLTGRDQGRVSPEGDVPYQFSVPVDRVRDGSALLMTHWGDEPLGIEHGGPVRFVLPGHYAMRSVKWLNRIEGVTEPFIGHFVNRYRYFGDDEHDDGSPVGAIRVRSVIARPGEGEVVPAGEIVISGSAWSGHGPVEEVAVSMDGGRSWQAAAVAPGSGPHAVSGWRLDMEVSPGNRTVMARATDAAGDTQPLESRWNRLGYGNNMVHSVGFEAR
jgi:DMSO/TMAO reductase YedYZ molybdopterin-dependent catalytic subunit